MRILKILGWLVGGIVVLLVIGVALVALFFDPNDYKTQIEQVVKDKTGRAFSLKGDLKLSVFPWLAVQVGPATLGNAAGFGDMPMVSIQGAKLGVRLRPLLGGQFEVGAVELDSPHIILIKNADGTNNWSDIGKTQDSETTETTQEDSGKLNASIASFSLRNASLDYTDRTTNTQTQLSSFNVTTGKLEPGKPFDFKSNFKLQRGNGMNIDTQLSANITADMDNSLYDIKQPDIALLLKSASYPKGLNVNIKASSIAADLKAQIAQISALSIDADGAKMSAELQATQIVDAPQFTGTIKLAQVSIRELAPKFGITLPSTSDAQAFKRLSFEAGIAGSSKAVDLKPLTLHLDDSTMTGNVGIADFASTAIRFNLAVDRINVDRYLPAPVKEAAASQQSTAPTPIPVDLIRGLNIVGKFALNECTYKNMQLSKLNVGVDARDNKLQLDPLQATLYDGKYRGAVLVDANGKLPHLVLEQHLDGINFAPLLDALYKTKRMSGRGSVNMKLAGNGADTDAIKKTLAGMLDFNVKEGAINGFDLWYEIRRARAVLKQQSIPTRSGPEQTNFTSLSGSATVDNGQLSNKDLVAAMQYLKVTGQGSINLVSNGIDYQVNAAVMKIPAEDKLAEQTQDIAGLSIPVRITGTIADPKVRPDVAGLVKEKAKQRIDEEKQKLEEKAKDKLKDKLRGLLGG